MRTEVLNARYVSEMFSAFVRNNKVEPAQVEDVLRAIKPGLSPSLVQGHIAKGGLRENPISNGTAMPGNLQGEKQFKPPNKLLKLREIPPDECRSKWKPPNGLQEDAANGFNLDAPTIGPVDLTVRATGGRLVSAQEPEPGDEVVLRTGGPVMTVLGSDDDRPRELFCVWFNEQRRRRQGTFHSDLLKIVE
jgi:uncharacterized protein YodC (DUF2158 family)